MIRGDNMADYKKLYFFLFNRISDMIKELQKIQQQAEERYLLSEEETEEK